MKEDKEMDPKTLIQKNYSPALGDNKQRSVCWKKKGIRKYFFRLF